eukprot:GILK01002693.1.p1 GENE.GILK01002693.1~~GILK01002693.1.p1  ORF type:complete len:445 (-),score=49.46 GILK01002693.1:104-1372(-)
MEDSEWKEVTRRKQSSSRRTAQADDDGLADLTASMSTVTLADLRWRLSELTVPGRPYPPDLEAFIDACLAKKLRKHPEDLLDVLRHIWPTDANNRTPFQETLIGDGSRLRQLTKTCSDELRAIRDAARSGSQNNRVSVGIVPWVQGPDGTWYALFQASFSAYDYDMKLDPFRGKVRDGEDMLAAACRELYEESCGLFQIPPSSLGRADRYTCPDRDGNELYHIPVEFTHRKEPKFNFQQVLQRVVDDFDVNRRSRNTGTDEVFKETCGIAFVSMAELISASARRTARGALQIPYLPRFAKQVTRIPNNKREWNDIKAMLRRRDLRRLTLARREGVEAHFYGPTTGDEFRYVPGTPRDATETQQDVRETDETAECLRVLKEATDEDALTAAIRQIATNWDSTEETIPTLREFIPEVRGMLGGP